ncbi:MAG: hypothetical protein EB075_05550 [Bacteroidetes bacterium]|nr:hypothetical protein [Bacteroidota bacterium]
MGINKVILLGNLGKDPEVRATSGGMAIARFPLATGERKKDQSGSITVCRIQSTASATPPR